METNKDKIVVLTNELLDRSIIRMKEAVLKAVSCGALNISEWDENKAKMIIPKIITIAVLEEEACQYKGKGTNWEKHVEKETKNLKRFI